MTNRQRSNMTTNAILVCDKCQAPTRHTYDSKQSERSPILGCGFQQSLMFKCGDCGTLRVWGAISG